MAGISDYYWVTMDCCYCCSSRTTVTRNLTYGARVMSRFGWVAGGGGDGARSSTSYLCHSSRCYEFPTRLVEASCAYITTMDLGSNDLILVVLTAPLSSAPIYYCLITCQCALIVAKGTPILFNMGSFS